MKSKVSITITLNIVTMILICFVSIKVNELASKSTEIESQINKLESLTERLRNTQITNMRRLGEIDLNTYKSLKIIRDIESDIKDIKDDTKEIRMKTMFN